MKWKMKILEDYTGGFGLIGSMLIGEIEQKTNISFKIVDNFEAYFIAIDVDYFPKTVYVQEGFIN